MEKYTPPQIFVDTSSKKDPWTVQSANLKRFFGSGTYQKLVDAIRADIEVISTNTMEVVYSIELPGFLISNFHNDYLNFLNKIYPNFFKGIKETKVEFLKYLEESNIDPGVIQIQSISFDTVVDVMLTAISSEDFGEDYYILLTEIFFYGGEILSDFIFICELKKCLTIKYPRDK